MRVSRTTVPPNGPAIIDRYTDNELREHSAELPAHGAAPTPALRCPLRPAPRRQHIGASAYARARCGLSLLLYAPAGAGARAPAAGWTAGSEARRVELGSPKFELFSTRHRACLG